MAGSRVDSSDYAGLFLADTPLLDTRAPLEFARGAFPAARNLPLMSDEERAAVGSCYKQRGQDAAIALGQELVSGVIRDARITAWREFARAHPEGYLYCFRGGLRSQIVQQWLRDSGIDYPRVSGGYKAMRRFLIDTPRGVFARCAGYPAGCRRDRYGQDAFYSACTAFDRSRGPGAASWLRLWPPVGRAADADRL
jgi:tRNA 2-selenouridine synthase